MKQLIIWIALALFLFLVCCLLWFVAMLLLTPPQIGPYAPGGEHHDTFLAVNTALSILIPLILVLGYSFVVVRAYRGIVKRHLKEGADEEQTGRDAGGSTDI